VGGYRGTGLPLILNLLLGGGNPFFIFFFFEKNPRFFPVASKYNLFITPSGGVERGGVLGFLNFARVVFFLGSFSGGETGGPGGRGGGAGGGNFFCAHCGGVKMGSYPGPGLVHP